MLTLMFAAFQIPLSWSELLKRTAKESSEDDCPRLSGTARLLLLSGSVSGGPVHPRARELLSAHEPYRRYRPSVATDCSSRCARVSGGAAQAHLEHRQRRHTHHWHPRCDLEQLRSSRRDRRQPQPGVRHRRRASLVEGALDRDRPDARAGGAGSSLVHVDRCGSNDGQPARVLIRTGVGVRMDVEDSAVAAGLPARSRRRSVWSITLHPTPNRTGRGSRLAP